MSANTIPQLSLLDSVEKVDIKPRKAFNHYSSFYDIKKELTDKQYLLFDKALCSVQFLEVHIDDIVFDDKILSIIWTSIKHTIKSNIEGYCNKNKINYESLFLRNINTPCQGGTQGAYQQEKEKGEEKGEEKEKGKEEYTDKLEKISNEDLKLHDLSLQKETYYEDTSDIYKEKLEYMINKKIAELEDKAIKKGVVPTILKYDAFIDGLLSKGYKYKNFLSAYSQWNRR